MLLKNSEIKKLKKCVFDAVNNDFIYRAETRAKMGEKACFGAFWRKCIILKIQKIFILVRLVRKRQRHYVHPITLLL